MSSNIDAKDEPIKLTETNSQLSIQEKEEIEEIQELEKIKQESKTRMRNVLCDYFGVSNDDENNMDLDADKCREKNIKLLKSKLMNGINYIIENYGGYAMECEIQKEDEKEISDFFKNEKKMYVQICVTDKPSISIITVSWSKLEDPFTNVKVYRCPNTLNSYLRECTIGYAGYAYMSYLPYKKYIF